MSLRPHRIALLAWAALLPLMAGTALAETTGPNCLGCHRASADEPIHAIMNTPHGALAGGGNAACLACHGESLEHGRNPSEESPSVSFGPKWFSDAEARTPSCQGCHEKDDQLLWMGSGHQKADMACDSCHNSHVQRDPAMSAIGGEACTDCHRDVAAQLRLPSRHPITEGKTGCTDCHNPHGGLGEADLIQVSLNDNCFSCHQALRGPFLWEHPPAAEDCSLCHRPHGSVHERLLTARGPALCQQCHAAAFHPSVAYGSEGLPGGSANQNLLGKNCLNCHSKPHGSNHPSGARLTR